MRAASFTGAHTYRIVARITSKGYLAPSTIAGAYDPARGVGEEQLGDVRAIYSGPYVYLAIPGTARAVYQQTYHHALRPEQTWARITVPQRYRGGSGFAALMGGISMMSAQQLNPRHLLTLLKSATQVRVAGHASGPGWTGAR